MEDVLANVQQNHCDGDGIQNAENGDGELDDVAQTNVGDSKAKYADAGNEGFVGYLATGELFKEEEIAVVRPMLVVMQAKKIMVAKTILPKPPK